jgi:hypothetical protein
VTDFGVRGFRQRRATMPVLLGHERSGMIIWRRRARARMAIARASERDQPGDHGAQERQEDDGFVHAA